MLAKLKSYYIIIASVAIAILYFLLTLSKEKARDAMQDEERKRLNNELDKLLKESDNVEHEADKAYQNYKRLLDKHPDIRDSLPKRKS